MRASYPYPTTPCVAVCQIDPKTGYCMGCYRTLKEIAQWGKLSEDARKALLPELAERKAEDMRRWEEKRKRDGNA